MRCFKNATLQGNYLLYANITTDRKNLNYRTPQKVMENRQYKSS